MDFYFENEWNHLDNEHKSIFFFITTPSLCLITVYFHSKELIKIIQTINFYMIIVNTVKFRRPKITLAQCNNLTETINLLKKKKNRNHKHLFFWNLFSCGYGISKKLCKTYNLVIWRKIYRCIAQRYRLVTYKKITSYSFYISHLV